MGILQELLDRAEQIRSIGTEARAEARALGVPSYYIDPAVGDGIIEELPDGTKRPLKAGNSKARKNERAA